MSAAHVVGAAVGWFAGTWTALMIYQLAMWVAP